MLEEADDGFISSSLDSLLDSFLDPFLDPLLDPFLDSFLDPFLDPFLDSLFFKQIEDRGHFLFRREPWNRRGRFLRPVFRPRRSLNSHLQSFEEKGVFVSRSLRRPSP